MDVGGHLGERKHPNFRYDSGVTRTLVVIALLFTLTGCYSGTRPPRIGSNAPDFTVQDSDHSVTLSQFRGQVVVLNFWATWCEPCRDELASITKLQEQLAGKPFAVLLINYGEARARVADFAKRESIGFSILLDPNQDASRAWRIRVLPSSFLVGPDGRVRHSVIGEIDWAQADAVDIVQSLSR
jgi:peroxiredoxin